MADPINVPLHWPQQSPIDLKNAISANLPKVTFDYRKPLSGVFEDANLKITSGVANLSFEGSTCPLKKLHLHSPAEHLVNGLRHALELHLVHEIPVSVARPTRGSMLVVVSVFLKEIGNKKARTASFFKELAAAYSATPSSGKQKKTADTLDNFDPRGLKPTNKDYFRYEGSLTTEEFDEVVSWIVFREPLSVEKQYLDQIKSRTEHEPRKVKQHARRFILKNF